MLIAANNGNLVYTKPYPTGRGRDFRSPTYNSYANRKITATCQTSTTRIRQYWDVHRTIDLCQDIMENDPTPNGKSWNTMQAGVDNYIRLCDTCSKMSDNHITCRQAYHIGIWYNEMHNH